MTDLQITLGPVAFKNPLFVASGTFGYGVEVPELVDVKRLGAIVTKSITLEPREGNPPPRTVETASGLLNSIGLANMGVEHYLKEMVPVYANIGCPIITNIAGSSSAEYETVLKKVESVSSDIIGYEINISCPNVDKGGLEFGVDTGLTARLTARLRRLTHKLLIMKLSPNVTDIGAIARAAEEEGADALSAINTVVGLSIDADRGKPHLSATYGGLSGPAIKPIGLACVHRVSRAVRIPLIGIGGITSAADVVEYLLAGASAVQIGTANYRDPAIAVQILTDLERYCLDRNIAAVRDLTGQLATTPK